MIEDCWCTVSIEAVCDCCGRIQTLDNTCPFSGMLGFFREILEDMLQDEGWTEIFDGGEELLLCPECIRCDERPAEDGDADDERVRA